MCGGYNAKRVFNRSSLTSLFPCVTFPLLRLNRVDVEYIPLPEGVAGQTTQTITHEQRTITMVEFQKVEESREKAEKRSGRSLVIPSQLFLSYMIFVQYRRTRPNTSHRNFVKCHS